MVAFWTDQKAGMDRDGIEFKGRTLPGKKKVAAERLLSFSLDFLYLGESEITEGYH